MRFYFDIHDGLGLWPDEEGLDLVDVQAAAVEAARSLAGVANNACGQQGDRMAIEVRTPAGPLFEAAIRFERKSANMPRGAAASLGKKREFEATGRSK